MTKPVINIADVKFLPRDAAFPLTATGDAPNIYEAEIARVSPRIGAQQLGYNVTSVPPGKCVRCQPTAML